MVLSRGQRSLVITDHSKFGRLGLVQVSGFDSFSELATDRPPPRDIAAALAQAGARLSIAGGEAGS
jgi:DeoR family glycerol-3-phosphate regulon repressor